MNIFKRIFYHTDIQYNEIINSEEYFEQKWRIRYIEKFHAFALYDMNSEKYLDLVNNSYKWRYDDTFFKDCVCSKHTIIDEYKKIVKISEPLMSVEKILDECGVKAIEQYLRKKKLEKL